MPWSPPGYGSETDVDCGGACAACADGLGCALDTDCASGWCAGGVCQPLGGGCDEGSAVDLGSQHTAATVATDACLKVTQYPGAWVQAVVLQTQAGGDYPIPYTWSNCTAGGSAVLGSEWTQQDLRPASNACPTVIELQGSGAGTVTLKWWGSG